MPAALENTYPLDGTVTDAEAGTSWQPAGNVYNNNNNSVDCLLVGMPAGTPAMPTSLYLNFIKPLGANPTQYKLESITYFQSGGATVIVRRLCNTAVRYELKYKDYDHFGTFEAQSDPPATYPTRSSITAGAFQVIF